MNQSYRMTGLISQIRKFVFAALLLVSGSASSAIVFDEVAIEAGLIPPKPMTSFGASWGDVDNDGWPDLFLNNHARKHSLYRNLRNGSFTDIITQVDGDNILDQKAFDDTHGASWMDFDNDGDQDLLVTTGNCCDPQFFVNDNGILYYRTVEYGMGDDIDKGGRMPIWIDADKDGRLEVGLMGFYPTAFLQLNGGKYERLPFGRLECKDIQYAQMIDLNADRELDIICVSKGQRYANRVYDTSTYPFQEIPEILPPAVADYDANDLVVGDFNNDQRTDMLLLRGQIRPSEIDINGKHLEAQLVLYDRGFSFKTGGVLDVILDWNQSGDPNQNGNIRIGANGKAPATENMRLDPNDPDNWGFKAYEPKPYPELYIGYDTATQRWKFQIYSAGKWVNTYIRIESTEEMSDLQSFGITPQDRSLRPVFMSNLPGGMTIRTANVGLDQAISCPSGAAGDFDNDMDLDLYLVCRGGVRNMKNRLYTNDGNGNFTLVEDSGGAAGPVGLAVENGAGTGESVVMADYNADGLLDLAVVNGMNMKPDNITGGPYSLFQNKGNPRNWIELDLIGTTSNRDAVGATVLATAGGVTQLREQNGGIHRWSQHHQRIHFGLAGNKTVNLRIQWPSGIVETYNNVDSNKIYTVREGQGIAERQLAGGGSDNREVCGKPNYNRATEAGVFIWKDCYRNTWSLRATGGGSADILKYIGGVTASRPFANVTPFSYESNDLISVTDAPAEVLFDMRSRNSGEDGINFTVPDGANACLDFSSIPAGTKIFVGEGRKAVTAPFNLDTLRGCDEEPPEPPNPGTAKCGAPAVNGATDNGIFVWRQCDSNNWFVMSAVSSGFQRYIGSITAPANKPFSKVQGSLLDEYDSLESSQPSRIDFNIVQQNPNVNGFWFEASCNSEAILDVAMPSDTKIYLGSNKVPSSGEATLVSPEACKPDPGPVDPPQPPLPQELVCGNPGFTGGEQSALFVWWDCGTNDWHVRGTSADGIERFRGAVASDKPLDQVQGFEIYPAEGDFLGQRSTGEIDYNFVLRNPNVNGFDFTVSCDATTSIRLDWLYETQMLVGSNRVPAIDNSFQFLSPESCVPAPGTTALDRAVCGEPFISGNDNALFIWKECDTDNWHIRGSADLGSARYIGSLGTDRSFSDVKGYKLSGDDKLTQINASSVSFNFVLTNPNTNGLDFSASCDAKVVADFQLPTGGDILLGVNKIKAPQNFELTDTGVCTNEPITLRIGETIRGTRTYQSSSVEDFE